MTRHYRLLSPLPFLPFPPADYATGDGRIPAWKNVAVPGALQALHAFAPSCVDHHYPPPPTRPATTVAPGRKTLDARHALARGAQRTAAVAPPTDLADLVRSIEETGEIDEDTSRRAVTDWLRAQEAGGNFTMRFQPLYSRRSESSGKSPPIREVSHFEALIRHPHHEPQEFIPVAEKWAPVELALLALRITAETAIQYEKASFSVNMPGAAFNDRDLPSLIAKVIADTGVDPKRIMIEVTETGLLPDVRRMRSALYVLREAGHQIAIDDYDMGHARRYISALRDGPNGLSLCNAVKVDRECVQLMNLSKYPELQRHLKVIDDEQAPLTEEQLSAIEEIEHDAFAAIVEFVGDMHQMGVRVIAEGVEHDLEERRLERAGVDELQGFLFSAPKLIPSAA